MKIDLKLDRLETHDRLIEFGKQADYISQGCKDCIDHRPCAYGNHPFYIFAHCRTHENGWQKRLIWEPRLTKPTAQTNSMLFRAYPGTDTIKVIWMIPAREQWASYQRENMLEHDITAQSIHDFQFNRAKLERKESDEISDDLKKSIMAQVRNEALSIVEAKKKDLMKVSSDKINDLFASSELDTENL